jgi:hypothetical protein
LIWSFQSELLIAQPQSETASRSKTEVTYCREMVKAMPSPVAAQISVHIGREMMPACWPYDKIGSVVVSRFSRSVEAKIYPTNPTIPPVIGRPNKANVARAERDELEGPGVARGPSEVGDRYGESCMLICHVTTAFCGRARLSNHCPNRFSTAPSATHCSPMFCREQLHCIDSPIGSASA